MKKSPAAANVIALPKHPQLLLKASFAPPEPALSPKRGLHKASLIRTETLVQEVPGKVCPVQTFTFRLDGHPSLPVSDHVRLECGDTMKLYLNDSSGNWTFKSYSPTRTSRPGEIDITVKLYPNGRNARLLRSLRVGQDHVYMAGPWRRKKRVPTSHAYLIAFGIGITEIYPVAKRLAQDGIPATLLYANRHREDVCFRPELELLERDHPLEVRYLYSRETDDLAPNEFSGRLDSPDVLREILGLEPNADSSPKDATAPTSARVSFLAVGSKPMMRQAWNCLSNLGYPRDKYELLQVL